MKKNIICLMLSLISITIYAMSENDVDPKEIKLSRTINPNIEKIKAEIRMHLDANTDINDPVWIRLICIASYYDECFDLIKEMLTRGIDPNVMLYETPVFKASRCGCIKNVELLLAFDADPNKGSNYSTPLIVAVQQGQVDIVKLLLAEYNINIDAQDEFGNTALMNVFDNISGLKHKNDMLDLLIILLDNDADIYIKNKKGQTIKDIIGKSIFSNWITIIENYE